MTAGEVAIPGPTQATDAAGVAMIDAIIARRQAELTRLTLAVRTSRQRGDRAESALLADQARAGDGDATPTELLTAVDATLGRAVHTAEAALAVARREAEGKVLDARRAGAELLRRAGADPALVPLPLGPPLPDGVIQAPPSAAELWRAAAPVPSEPPMSSTAPTGSSATAPLSTTGASTTPTAAPSGVTPIVIVPPSTAPVDGHDAAEVHDMFWQQVPAERRVRDRLRRRLPREDT